MNSRPPAAATPADDGREPGVDAYGRSARTVQRMVRHRLGWNGLAVRSAAVGSAHASHPPRPTTSRFDHQPSDPSHPIWKHHPDDHDHVAPVWLRKHHPQADAPCLTTGQADDPRDQDCAASVVDVNPCTDVTDVCAATNAPVADQSERSTHHRPPTPREKPPSRSADLRCRFVAKQTTGIPATPMMPIAAQSTGCLTHPAAVRSLATAARANRDPAGGTLRHGKAVAHTDLETRLGRVDRLHTLPKARSVPLLSLQHQIHPGMDHLVTKRAFRRLPRQGIQQRPRQNNLAPEGWRHRWPSPVETGRSAQAAITPTQRKQGLLSLAERSLEMLPIQAMKQREQWLERHEWRRP